MGSTRGPHPNKAGGQEPSEEAAGRRWRGGQTEGRADQGAGWAARASEAARVPSFGAVSLGATD